MAILNKPLPLDERITKLRAEIDAFIDARVAVIAKTCVGVPAAAIRNITTKHSGCRCAVYLDLKAADDKAAARAKEAGKGAAA